MISSNANQLAAKQQKQYSRYWVWAGLVAVILFTSAIRVRVLETPLQRDEGEYAYAGKLILEGVAPYSQAYNMKMPGTYAAYAVLMAVFGQTLNGIHIGLIVVNVITILLMFLLGKRLFDPLIGLAAAVAFALLSVGRAVRGTSANDEHFVILFAVAGLVLLLRATQFRRSWLLLVGSVLLGLAFLMKQHGAAFIAFGGLYLLFCELRHRPFSWKTFFFRNFLFLVGVLLPFVILCMVLWWAGVFEKFRFWVFDYAQQYVSIVPLSVGLRRLRKWLTLISHEAILLWILAGIGLVGLCISSKTRQQRLFVLGFLFFSFLAICPGLYFRPHYFILLLPAVALLTGIAVGFVYELLAARFQPALVAKVVSILLVLLVLLHVIYQQRNFFFVMSPNMVSRITYGMNPFPESLEIARFIKENTSKEDRIAILGSEPQIFFYADRRSATGYIYTYTLMELQPHALQMQEEMIREIEAASPEFLIIVNISSSWLERPGSNRTIFYWADSYALRYYHLVGFVDIVKSKQTVYRWHERAAGYSPISENNVLIYRRNHTRTTPSSAPSDTNNKLKSLACL